jgi:phage shock protein PspC (stress-responsive transcriptional regulator)
MKKNISINISGIIFHIEEDGYETLRKYLDSIKNYFGSFEDSSEILSDIESRIAEIFLSKLNDGKQVITAEDVQSLIATMGSVNDFKAAEEETKGSESTGTPSEPELEDTPKPGSSPSKKLFRDQKRKILGGVCAGLGNYFSIDPVWPRLLFALLVLGTYGVFIVVYIVLWIVLPFSHDLEDESSVKKMYRDPENKVVGGVAGGVAAFFGADVVLIRVLFVLGTIFFLSGLVVYVILWIALPEAKTITEKMQMQGEPLTLSNIESSVKKSIHEKDAHEESMLAKIILFPFRLVAAVLNGIVRIAGPILKVIVDIFRVAIGLVISLTGFMLIISFIMVFGLLMGIFTYSSFTLWDMHVNAMNFPLESIRLAFPTWTIIFAFLVVLIPALFIMLIGNSIIAKKIVFNAITGWSFFVIFFVGVIFLSFRIPQLVYYFKTEGEFKAEKTFDINHKTPVLKIHQTGLDDYDFTNLAIKGYDGKNLKLMQRFGAQGANKLQAKANAQQVDYKIEQLDSVITFDSNISFRKDTRFSFQRLDMDLLVPYDQPFVIDEELWELIGNHWRYDYYGNNETQTFKFDKTGKLECASCPEPPKDMSGISPTDEFGLKDFNEVEMTGLFDVVIRQGHEYAVKMEGSESQKKLYSVALNDETLEINYQSPKKTFWKETFNDNDLVKITIFMPSLQKLKVTGAGKVKIVDFREDESKITAMGAMMIDARISAHQLFLDVSGPIVFELDGEGDYLEASVNKVAQLKASSYSVNNANIEAKELGQARVNVHGRLEIDKDFTSTVKYQGNPEMIKEE